MILDFAQITVLNPDLARRAFDIPVTVRTRPPSQEAFSWEHVGENKDTTAFWYGATIASHPSGGALLARASATIRRCIGLARLGAGVGHSELVQWEGVFETGDWTRVTGTPLLALNTTYYLGTTPGTLLALAPSTVGQLVQRIGQSISTTELQLNLGEPVLL